MRSDPLVVAGIAAALIASTYALTGLPVSGVVLMGVPSGVALVYRFDRTSPSAVEDADAHPDRRRWMRRHRGYVWGSTAVYGAVGTWAFVHLSIAAQAATVLFVALGVLYVRPVAGWRVKDIGAAKTVVVAAAWSAGVVVLPVLHGAGGTGGYGAEPLGLWMYRLGWLVPNLLCSDWSDRAADRAAGLATVAHAWSHAQTRGIAALSAATAMVGAAAMAIATGSVLWAAEAVALAGLVAGVARCPVHPTATYRLALDLYMAVPGLLAVAVRMWERGL